MSTMYVLACMVHWLQQCCCVLADLDDYEDIVIDEAFARSKGCAMPELVNLLDDPDVLLHLKVRSASMFNVLLLFSPKLRCY